ncbi:MAG TPA: 50S ribosomal protein L23 [Gammaproteobacteria bacterium]|nr:50S ribosomal protein L23 [Gammaproteobacteria bacterium]
MSNVAHEEYLMKVLLAPRVTEKSALANINRQYVFKVLNDATKPEIKQAVELLFNVKVNAVQVSRVKSKTRRFGKIQGQRKAWKKAYVKLAEGHKIDLAGA